MIDFYEYIDDYKNGLLKGELLSQFEKALLVGPDLKQAVEDHDVADEALDFLLESEIRKVMEEETVKTKEEIKPRGFKSYLLFLLISTVIALIAYFLIGQKQQTNEQLFASHFTPYIGDAIRGDNISEEMSLCDKGHYYMTKKKYFVAKKAFQKSIQVNEACAKAEWYLALEYLREDNYAQCRIHLENIIQNEGHPYRKKAVELVELVE